MTIFFDRCTRSAHEGHAPRAFWWCAWSWCFWRWPSTSSSMSWPLNTLRLAARDMWYVQWFSESASCTPSVYSVFDYRNIDMTARVLEIIFMIYWAHVIIHVILHVHVCVDILYTGLFAPCIFHPSTFTNGFVPLEFTLYIVRNRILFN